MIVKVYVTMCKLHFQPQDETKWSFFHLFLSLRIIVSKQSLVSYRKAFLLSITFDMFLP